MQRLRASLENSLTVTPSSCNLALAISKPEFIVQGPPQIIKVVIHTKEDTIYAGKLSIKALAPAPSSAVTVTPSSSELLVLDSSPDSKVKITSQDGVFFPAMY